VDWQIDELIRQLQELNCRLKQSNLSGSTPVGSAVAIPPTADPNSLIPAPRNGFLSPSSLLGPPVYPSPVDSNGAIQYTDTPSPKFNSALVLANTNYLIVEANDNRKYLHISWGGTITVSPTPLSAVGPGPGVATGTTSGLHMNIKDHGPLVTMAWYARHTANFNILSWEVF